MFLFVCFGFLFVCLVFGVFFRESGCLTSWFNYFYAAKQMYVYRFKVLKLAYLLFVFLGCFFGFVLFLFLKNV